MLFRSSSSVDSPLASAEATTIIDQTLNDKQVTDPEQQKNLRYNLRVPKPKVFHDYYTFHTKVKNSITQYKHLAVEALEKELTNIINYNTWTPRKLKDIPKNHRILPSSAFVKEKNSRLLVCSQN